MADDCQINMRKYHAQEKTSGLSISFSRKLAAMVKEHRIELVHAHDSHAHTFCVLASLFFGMKKPIVLHRRVDYPVSKNRFSRFKYNFPQIARIICVSHEVQRIVGQSLDDQSKTVVIYDGIDLNKFSSSRKSYLRDYLGRPDHETLIGNASAVTQQKDYFTFVNTAEKVIAKRKDVHFVILGDGDQRFEIEQYVRGKGLKKHFSMLGYRRDIAKLLPGMDILLFTSEKEGLGTTLIDAMVCGIPIVSTRAGGIKELLEDQKTALLYDVRDSDGLAEGVLTLLNDPERKAELIAAGKTRAIDFNKHDMARQTYREYLDILGHP